MSRALGKMNAGRIDRSPRLQRILAILKAADFPLSAEEISKRAYEFARSGRIMLNISTNIGEMRSDENKAAGYTVSEARAWKGGKYHWHDGRPRYWLIAAPGWAPRWRVTDEGELRKATRDQEACSADPVVHSKLNTQHLTLNNASPGICHNPPCKNDIPAERAAAGSLTCSDECFKLWRESIRPKFQTEPAQGSLL